MLLLRTSCRDAFNLIYGVTIRVHYECSAYGYPDVFGGCKTQCVLGCANPRYNVGGVMTQSPSVETYKEETG